MGTAKAVVRVAVVGAGYWGPNLVRNLISLEAVELTGVVDQRPGRLEYVRQKFGDVPVYAESHTLITDSITDAIVLATPVSSHADLAIRALEAGKHVFIEKPMARSVAECDAILEAAARAGRRVAVGHVFLHHPAVEAMRVAIAEGRIGRPCYCESARVNLGPPATEVSVLWDLLPHDLSILLDLAASPPLAVTAFGRNFVHPSLVDVAFVHVAFADGTFAQHHVSWLSPERVRRFFVAGARGSLLFNDAVAEGKLRFVDQGVDSRVGAKDGDAKELFYRPGEVRELALGPGEPLARECAAFIGAVRENAPLRNDGLSGRAVIALVEAAEQSIAAGGRSVPVVAA